MPITDDRGDSHEAEASERQERDEHERVGEGLHHCRHTRPVPLQALQVSMMLASSMNSPSN